MTIQFTGEGEGIIGYRVRKGLFNTSVLQLMINSEWCDVKYDEAPRALVSSFTMLEEVLELKLALEGGKND